jgi:hypothetical protein
LTTRHSRTAVALASIIMALRVFVVNPAMAAGVQPVPVAVKGFLPGYTDSELTHLISSCVARVPAPVPTSRARAQFEVRVGTEYLPRETTVVQASLLEGGQVLASRWARESALDTAPSAVFCRTVSDLARQLWQQAG